MISLKVLNSADIQQNLALAYLELGKPAEAVEILERLSAESPDGFKIQASLTIAYHRGDNRKKSEQLLRELEKRATGGVGNFVRLASVYSEIGLQEQAIAALQKGLETRDDRMMWVKVSPHFDNLRSDPRFQEIVRRMNLWKIGWLII
jgi:tetratricopeptide (TPR) repeat protein